MTNTKTELYQLSKNWVISGTVNITHKSELEFYANQWLSYEKIDAEDAEKNIEVEQIPTTKYKVTNKNWNSTIYDVSSEDELAIFKNADTTVEKLKEPKEVIEKIPDTTVEKDKKKESK